MLTLSYAFLIFAFSPSIMAIKTARSATLNQKNVAGTPATLLHNTDARLLKGVWALVVPSASVVLQAPKVEVPAPAEAPAPAVLRAPNVQAPAETPVYNYRLDALIRFQDRDHNGKVEKLDLLSLERKLVRKEYRVVRPTPSSLTVPPVNEDVPLDRWRFCLKDTYWGRIPELVGPLMSGDNEDFGDIIHFEGMTPLEDAAGLSVTFLPEKKRGGFIRAQASYQLSSEDINAAKTLLSLWAAEVTGRSEKRQRSIF